MLSNDNYDPRSVSVSAQTRIELHEDAVIYDPASISYMVRKTLFNPLPHKAYRYAETIYYTLYVDCMVVSMVAALGGGGEL